MSAVVFPKRFAISRLEPGQLGGRDHASVIDFAVDVRLAPEGGQRPETFEGVCRRHGQLIRDGRDVPPLLSSVSV
jgi:hypothetical protein